MTSVPQKKLIFCVTRAHNIALTTPFYVNVTVNNTRSFKTCQRYPSPTLYWNGIEDILKSKVEESLMQETDSQQKDSQVQKENKKYATFGIKNTQHPLNTSLGNATNSVPISKPTINHTSGEIPNKKQDASRTSTKEEIPTGGGDSGSISAIGGSVNNASDNQYSNKVTDVNNIQGNDSTEYDRLLEMHKIKLNEENRRKPIEFPRVLHTIDLKGKNSIFPSEPRRIPIVVTVFTMKDEFVGRSTGMLDTSVFVNRNHLKSEEENEDAKVYQVVNLRFQLSPLNSMYVDITFTIYDELVHMNDYEQIQKFVFQNDLESVKYLLEDNPSSVISKGLKFNSFLKEYILENVVEGNQTLLHIACEKGYTKMVQYFLQTSIPKEMNLAIYNSKLETPFHVACRKKQTSVMNYLMSNSKNYKLIDYSLQFLQRNHVLFKISQSTHTRLDYYLQTFSKISLKQLSSSVGEDTNVYMSPLHDACVKDNEKILKMLLQYYLSIPELGGDFDQILLECLCLCAFIGSIRCLSILIQFGAKIDGSLSSIDSSCYSNAVPLYFACIAKQHKIISRLLERGASIPLQATTANLERLKNPILIKKVLPLIVCMLVEDTNPEFLVDIYKMNFRMQLKGNEIMDLLFVASLYCRPLFEEILTDKSVDWKSRSEASGCYLMHYIAQFASHDQLIYLEEKGVFSDTEFLNIVNDERETPLHIAARHGNVHAIKLFLRLGARHDLVDNHSWTPLMTALEYAQSYSTFTLFEFQESKISILPERYHIYLAILLGEKELALRLLKDEDSLDPTSSLTLGPCLYYCATPLNPNMETFHISIVQNCIARVLILKNFKFSSTLGNIITFAITNKRDDIAKLFVTQNIPIGPSILELYTNPDSRSDFQRFCNYIIGTNQSILDVVDEHGRGILHFIAEKKDNETLAMLAPHLKSLPSLVGKDMQGRTPLHILCRSSSRVLPEIDKNIARILFQLGDRPFILDNQGYSAYYYLLLNRNYHICETFMSILGNDSVLKPFVGKVLYPPVSNKSVLRELLDSRMRDMNSLLDAIEFFVYHKVNILLVGFDITQYCLQSKDILRLFVSTNVEVLKRHDENGDNCVHQLFKNGFPLSRDIIQILNSSDLFKELINSRNLKGETPLHICFKNHHLYQCAREILEICKEGDISFNEEDESGNTILHLIVQNGELQSLELLLERYGKSINIHILNSQTKENAFDMLLKTDIAHKSEMASLLLRNGISVSESSLMNAINLHLKNTLWENRSYWDIPTLIREGKFTQAQKSIHAGGCTTRFDFNDQGLTAYHEAVLSKSIDIIRTLLDCGGNMNALSVDGDTALHIASQQGFVDIVRLLARHPKCDVDLEDCEGHTSLQSIMIKRPPNNFIRTVQVLLENGADISKVDEHGHTLLHLYCMNNQLQDTTVITVLCKKNRQLLNEPDNVGNTPLHYAAQSENIDLVKKLASSRYTNIYHRNNEKKLPQDMSTNAAIRQIVFDRYTKGYLYKRAPTGVVRLYKKRWFVLQPDYIRYYQSDELKETKGEIAVKDITAIKQVDVITYKFEILTKQSNRKYELQAEDKQRFEMWMKALSLRFKTV